MSEIDKEFDKKFSLWCEDLIDKEILDKNNKTLELLFKEKIKNKQLEFFDFNIFLKHFNYAFIDNLILYIDENKNVIGTVLFPKLHGGRVGLVHGGSLHFALNLSIKAFLKFNNFIYDNMTNVKTKYMKKIPINSLLLINTFREDNNAISQLIDSENKICVEVIYKLFNELHKF